jgi:hypothetical protein
MNMHFALGFAAAEPLRSVSRIVGEVRGVKEVKTKQAEACATAQGDTFVNA